MLILADSQYCHSTYLLKRVSLWQKLVFRLYNTFSVKQFLPALLYLIAFPFVIHAQDSSSHVQWSFDLKKTGTGKFQLTATGSIDKGWGTFSLSMPDDMPNMRITLDSGQASKLVSVKETGTPIKEQNAALGAEISYFKDQVLLTADIETSDPSKGISGILTHMSFRNEEFTNPVETPFRFVSNGSGELVYKSSALQESASADTLIKRDAISLDNPVVRVGGTGAEGSQSLARIFFLGLIGGLLALIMPCTFPMIPMTVAFFTKKAVTPSQGIRNAFLYGFFIFLIYVLISVPFYFLGTGNESILNNISTNAWLNLFFAAVFFVFALSFFGWFDIGLPGSVANSVDAKSGIGSIGGIFFMALTLAIVSFSCTGPILGTLLVGALNDNGGAIQLTVAMAGFGIALGLPFGLFAMFPRWLSKLPRSGSWMNTVKIVFAFVELALFIKFLSNADLVMHWGLLKREVFFAIWILIGAATTLYLFGILKFRHDPPPPKLSKGRIFTGLLFLAFTLYLVPGVTNTKYANLGLISGFPPPLNYSVYGHESAHGKGVEANVSNDYFAALRLAREQNKPVLLDFTGWACVNCRKMEEQVWPDPRVKELIEKNFVLVSLYVDDRKKLDKDKQFLFTLPDGTRKAIRDVGDVYSSMQIQNFRNASQPLYAIVSPGEQLLNLPVGYTPNIDEYAAWLQSGLDAFNQVTKK
jgi:thiol:disulfide interchange protein